MMRKRKPSHPGEILGELYIKSLRLNLEKLEAFLEKYGEADESIGLELQDAFF